MKEGFTFNKVSLMFLRNVIFKNCGGGGGGLTENRKEPLFFFWGGGSYKKQGPFSQVQIYVVANSDDYWIRGFRLIFEGKDCYQLFISVFQIRFQGKHEQGTGTCDPYGYPCHFVG